VGNVSSAPPVLSSVPRFSTPVFSKSGRVACHRFATEPSAVLGPLSDDELEAAYDFVLEQFALELLIGADKNSEWSAGKLVIDANHGPIHLLQAAFYAVRLEVQRRNAAVVVA
jgi:hypothetical protein